MLSSLALDRARIAELNSQILAVQNSLVALKNELKSVQARLDAYRYPILTMPNEMVSHIFVYTLPPYPLCSPLWGHFSPNALGQVCRKWRDIALSTPMLWRAPSFVLSSLWSPRGLCLALERGLKLFEAWLTRSGSCPLSIQLKDARSSAALTHVSLNRFAEIIIRHLHHVEHIDLSASDKVDLSQLASVSAVSLMPLLRVLKLGSWSTEDSFPVARFLNAPLLRSVHIIRLSSPSKLQLPWHQLTSLILEGVSARTSAAILQKTVNLVDFRLRPSMQTTPIDSDLPGDMSISLNHLESLEIERQWIAFLSSLTLPALQSLKITQCSAVADLWSLDNLLFRWGCNLERLHVTSKGSSNYFGDSTRDSYRSKFPSIPTILVEQC
ncbi:F-box domain-containing protein [Mycena sanguinolenta]|uniref:F-box domain-containing protein n=1 Tax=Mycena sanguinolenta TaxID=230812 RepID=A0A8H7D6W9_9AGAR|nr:F-box domain-containing protein [Mycena sanguinolenta]